MSSFASIKALIQRLTRGLCYGGMFLLIPLMLLTSTEVVSRGFFNKAIPGALELSSYLLAIFILTGIAYTHQVKGHVRVTMLLDRLPARVSHVLDIITGLLGLFIIVLLLWQGVVVGLEETAVSDQLRVPQRPFRLLVALAAFFLSLEIVLDLIESFRRLARGESWTQ